MFFCFISVNRVCARLIKKGRPIRESRKRKAAASSTVSQEIDYKYSRLYQSAPPPPPPLLVEAIVRVDQGIEQPLPPPPSPTLICVEGVDKGSGVAEGVVRFPAALL